MTLSADSKIFGVVGFRERVGEKRAHRLKSRQAYSSISADMFGSYVQPMHTEVVYMEGLSSLNLAFH